MQCTLSMSPDRKKNEPSLVIEPPRIGKLNAMSIYRILKNPISFVSNVSNGDTTANEDDYTFGAFLYPELQPVLKHVDTNEADR